MDHWSIQQQESTHFKVLGLLLINKNHLENRFLLHQGELKRFLNMENVHQITQVKDCQKGLPLWGFVVCQKDDPLSILNGWGGGLHHFLGSGYFYSLYDLALLV